MPEPIDELQKEFRDSVRVDLREIRKDTQEIRNSINVMVPIADFQKLQMRVEKLENWKSWVAGVAATASLLVTAAAEWIRHILGNGK